MRRGHSHGQVMDGPIATAKCVVSFHCPDAHSATLAIVAPIAPEAKAEFQDLKESFMDIDFKFIENVLMKLLLVIVSLVFVCSFQNSTRALCVQEPQAKLRKGPSTRWPITAEVIQYTALEKLSKQKGWYRVKDVDGEIHWVREDIVTSKYSCATVKDDIANLRAGPGKKFEMLKYSPVEKYLSFRVLEKKGEWLKVEDLEGDSAWVMSSLVFVR